MPTPKLWSKLENAGDVTSPQIGTGGAVVGSPTYVAAKFNNGILSDVDSEGCYFPCAANSINSSKGTIEFWAKMNFDETHGDTHYLIDFYLAGTGGIVLNFIPAYDDFRCQVYRDSVKVAEVVTEGMVWDVGDLMHFGLTWDREGNDIGDGKTLALYIDNVLKASVTDTWDAGSVPTNMYVGTNQVGSYHSDAVIDNLKIYDSCKTNFRDCWAEDTSLHMGHTAIGETTYDHIADYIYGSLFLATVSAKLSSITMYTKYSASAHMKCALYDTVKDLLGETEEKLIVPGTDEWLTFTFVTPPDVVAGTEYWLMFWRDAKVTHPRSTGAGINGMSKAQAYNGWPATIGAVSTNAYAFSLYATYYEAPPPGAKTMVQAALISAIPLIAIPTLGQILKYAGG